MLLAEEKVATATAAGAEKVAEHVEESISFVNHVQSLLLEYLPSIILAIIVLICKTSISTIDESHRL